MVDSRIVEAELAGGQLGNTPIAGPVREATPKKKSAPIWTSSKLP